MANEPHYIWILGKQEGKLSCDKINKNNHFSILLWNGVSCVHDVQTPAAPEQRTVPLFEGYLAYNGPIKSPPATETKSLGWVSVPPPACGLSCTICSYFILTWTEGRRQSTMICLRKFWPVMKSSLWIWYMLCTQVRLAFPALAVCSYGTESFLDRHQGKHRTVVPPRPRTGKSSLISRFRWTFTRTVVSKLR